jgi:5-methylcytosine-specific restriction enzyme B
LLVKTVKNVSSFWGPVHIRGATIRLNFGEWQIIGFGGRSDNDELEMWLVLLDRLAGDLGLASNGMFSVAENEPTVNLRVVTDGMVRRGDPNILDMYWETLAHVAQRSRTWQKTRYRRHHRERIANAVFDATELANLLSGGLGVEAMERAEDDSTDGFFSSITFDLLTQLAENPTNAFYQAHKEEFVEHVEEPFKAFMRALAERLPPMAKDRLETEKNIFSRIPKNDYGQGGAWAHYWGAFYPKSGQRTADAQLFAYINASELSIGFYIGEYGDVPRQRLWRNLREKQSVLLHGPVSQQFDTLDLRCGDRGLERTDWRTWLAQNQPVPRVLVVLTPDEAAAMSKDDLLDLGQRTFEALFPLALLAMDDDPLSSIQTYLGEEPEELPINPPYPLEQLAAKTGFTMDALRAWLAALAHKRQAVLYGPPGTGKTFMAKELAQHLVAEGDGLVETLQFHPAYAYEDFIGGLRPVEGSDGRLIYRVVPGRFVEFCRQATQRQGTCVLIIDEINRAELARVFGELMYLLEYRDESVPLAVSGSTFSIPKNVRILGTMNTADRSIALVDHALRRRFAFIRLQPKHEVLRAWHQQHTGWDVSGLLAVLDRVNARIADENYEVGISFFFLPNPDTDLEGVWRTEIEPYLEEYFFDQPHEVTALSWGAIRGEVLSA